MARFFGWMVLAQWLLASSVGRAQGLPDTLRHSDWRLFWNSEFNQAGDSSTLAKQWQFAYPWGRNLGGAGGEYYTGEQMAVDTAGVLHLLAQRRAQPRAYSPDSAPARLLSYESGMIFSRAVQDSMRLRGCDERPGFTYGLFEIRCRMPNTPNSFSAFWLYGFPDELDVFEAGGSDLMSNNIVLWNHPYWRQGPADAPNEASQSFFYWAGPGHLTDDFHTLAVSWQPQELVYYFDGVPIRHETRLLPIGCTMDVMANLGMYSWATAKAAAFDIDYIRVYKSRQGVPQPPVTPVAPANTYYQGPRTTAAVLGAARPEMRWRVHQQPDRRPRLVVQANVNPRDFNTLALPTADRWVASMPAFNEADSPQHWIASPDSGRSSLSWTLYDLCGRPVRSSQQLPAAGWELGWPNLAPGAYCLRLRIGTLQIRQNLYQLGRPAQQEFTKEWLGSPPNEATSE